MSNERLSDRAFGLAMGCVFGFIALIGWLLTERVLVWAVAISCSMLALGLIAPGLLLPLNRMWSLLAVRLGVLNNHVLLGVFFYLVVTPFGLTIRLFRRRLLLRRPDPALGTYWTPVGRQASAETYPDMF